MDLNLYNKSKQIRRRNNYIYRRKKQNVNRNKHHKTCHCKQCTDKKHNKISMKALDKRYCVYDQNEYINDESNILKQKCFICKRFIEAIHLKRIKCAICVKYLQTQLVFDFAVIQYLICTECIFSADICAEHGQCRFCFLIESFKTPSKTFYWPHYRINCFRKRRKALLPQEIMIRTNAIKKELKWEWNKKVVYCYEIDETLAKREIEMLKFYHGPVVGVNGKWFGLIVLYQFNKYLRECQNEQCNNKSGSSHCMNHRQCIVCGCYDVDGWCRNCDECKHLYCVRYRPCGDDRRCINCYKKEDAMKLHKIVNAFVGDRFYADIIRLIYNYSVGFVFVCANYKKCKTATFFKNSYELQSRGEALFYAYDVNVNNTMIDGLTCWNGKYKRVFCLDCKKKLVVCKYRRCGNRELKGFGGQCFYHKWVNELNERELRDKECNKCNESIAIPNEQYLQNSKYLQNESEIQVGFTLNDTLMDAYQTKNWNQKRKKRSKYSNNLSKTVVFVNNSRKRKSFWKRKSDKKANNKSIRKNKRDLCCNVNILLELQY